jgi:hypothetical protein
MSALLFIDQNSNLIEKKYIMYRIQRIFEYKNIIKFQILQNHII